MSELDSHMGLQGTSFVLSSQLQPTPPSNTQTVKEGGDDKPLESHEVIELQTFSERKAWIEDKIKVWERKMFGVLLVFISFSSSNLCRP